MDYTGTGNSLNMRHPHVLQLIMDSLRYWVNEMHVDGFRFDLAATLARELHDVDKLSSFFDLIQQDPVVSQVKLIAEPWDVGEGGYQVGNFPPLWSEWNGKYRDEVRDFWRGADHTVAEFGYRFTGSSDLYQSNGRTPSASINFVTAHDGFTLTDLVSYESKHNEANGEDNQDGTDDNRSWNGGVEGPTDDADVLALRRRQRRNLLATLLLSQGVPMLLGGDEIGRTQSGNNNAYAQDNEISWYDWDHVDTDLLAFTRRVSELRRRHPVFRRRKWFQGRPIMGEQADDIEWFTPDGADHDRGRLEGHLRPLDRRVPQRRRHHRAGDPRPAGGGRQLLRRLQRLRGRARLRAAGRPATPSSGPWCSTPPPTTPIWPWCSTPAARPPPPTGRDPGAQGRRPPDRRVAGRWWCCGRSGRSDAGRGAARCRRGAPAVRRPAGRRRPCRGGLGPLVAAPACRPAAGRPSTRPTRRR